jgi:5'-nucleotidase
MNDTHSHLEAAEQTLTIAGIPTKVYLGGFARLKSALNTVRSKSPNVLVVHSGDMVQGTFYFIKYQGEVDSEFLNLLGIDAACPGNHEFDKGPELLAGMMKRANFPIVSANLDVSQEPALAGKLFPYIIKKIGPHTIGIIGVTTPEATIVSHPGPNIVFRDIPSSVMQSVDMLQAQGVQTIILLSHLGYEEDIDLAKKLRGVTVIIGGHTHSLLGDRTNFGSLGLTPAGDYPTVVKDAEGKTILVVQSWEWAKALGALQITLDDEGRALSWIGAPTLIVGDRFMQKNQNISSDSSAYEKIRTILMHSNVAVVYQDDPYMRKRLDKYSRPIQEMMGTVIGKSMHDLKRANNAGPGLLVADAMLWKTKAAGAVIALQNPGGVRKDLLSGDITIGSIYEILPFGNTLVLLDLSGHELHTALEEALEHQLSNGSKDPYLYVSGVSFRIDVSAKKGNRVKDLNLILADGQTVPIISDQKYRIVTNNYLADGGDGMNALKESTTFRRDTGFSDAEVLIEYIKYKGTISRPSDIRPFRRPVSLDLHILKQAA